MKKELLFLIIVIVIFNCGYSQKKENKILFVEYIQGVSIYKSEGGQAFGCEINYQSNNDLFTIRFFNNDFEFRNGGSIGFGQPIVSEKTNQKLNELSLLYGKRLIKKGLSYSVSIGASYNFYKTDFIKIIDGTITDMTNSSGNYFGIPYEFNIKWFKKNKSKYKVVGLIPIGKKTAIGNSIGFKIYGNISKKSLIGFGIVFGIGKHKKYE